MNLTRTFLAILMFSFLAKTEASYKVYLVHGYGGLGLELGKIQLSLKKNGFTSEIYKYPSLREDVDTVANELFTKIRNEGFDTVSFVTHSMGALVVRALYEHLQPNVQFPVIHRIVTIAPPNKGSPIADFLNKYNFLKCLTGPNMVNLTTNPITGADKYPLPTCEVGIIIGITDDTRWGIVLLNGVNDGIVLAKSTMLGIEKERVYVSASHVGLLFKKKVKRHVIGFLKNSTFDSSSVN
jgi:triacylglycerol lipase